MLDNILNILFPQSCPVCNERASDHEIAPICPECWLTIQPHNGPQCGRCGRPLVSDASGTCGECLKHEPAFKCAKSFGLYEGALKKAVNLFKYHNVRRLSLPLSAVMLQNDLPRVEAVIPVPLFKKRLRHRGFNQSALLAGHIAARLGAELMIDHLVKIRDTLPQVGLSSPERRRNIRNAFRIRECGKVSGKRVLLVDDVITTGATIRECSRVLKRAGAGDIYVHALAYSVAD